jgi:hypothetical protein
MELINISLNSGRNKKKMDGKSGKRHRWIQGVEEYWGLDSSTH